FWYKWTQLFKTEMEKNKPKKFFVHANSTHSISLVKDFKIGILIYT
ncbi:MAG: IS1595 family transposase, partial [Bacilli bacterium]|nr:IS1595 family transposase [Bacilli bacterium]